MMDDLQELREYLKKSSFEDIKDSISSFKLSGPNRSRTRLGVSSNQNFFPLYDYKLEDILDILYEYKRFDLIAEFLNEDKNNYFDDRKYELIEALGYIPSKYFNDNDVFEYYVSRGNFDIAVTFNFYLNPHPEYDKELKEAALRNCLKLGISDFYTNKYIIEALIELNRMDLFLDLKPFFINYMVGKYKVVFDFFVEHNRFDVLDNFDKSFITDDFIKNNFDKIFEVMTNHLWYGCRDSKFFFDECIKRGRFDLLFQFNVEFITDDIISKYSSEIASAFDEKKINLSEKKFFLDKKEIFDKIVELGKYKWMIYFDKSLFTDEIITEYVDEILDCLDKKRSDKFSDSKILLNICLERKNFKWLDYFNEDLLSIDILEKYVDDIVDYYSSNKYVEIPAIFFTSKHFLEKFYERKQYDIVLHFSEELLESSNYLKTIFSSNYYFRDFPQNNEYLFEKVVEYKRFDLLDNFSQLVTDEFLLDNFELIYISTARCPGLLKTNYTFFEKVLNDKNIEYLLSFDEALITEEIIENNLEDFFDYIKLISSFNFSRVLSRSKVLFEKCVSEKEFYLVNRFEENLFNDEFISNNINELINYEFDFLPYKLRENKEFFNACIDNKKINLLIDFDSSLLTNDFFKANIKDFYNYIVLTDCVPSSLNKNEILFQECLVNKNYNLLLKFDNSLLENGVLEEHCDEIYNFVVISNNLPPLLSTSKTFFDKCIYEKNYKLIKKFHSSLFTSEFVAENLNFLYEFCVSTNAIPYQLEESDILFKKCLDENNFIFMLNFSSILLTEEIIIKYLDEFFNGMCSLRHVPSSAKKSKDLFYKCLKEKNYELLFQFDSSLFVEEIMIPNIDDIYQFIITTSSLPLVLRDNKFIFNKFLMEKNYNFLYKFEECLFDSKLLFDDLEGLYNYILKTNYLPNVFKNSKELFDYFIYKKDYSLLYMFDTNLLTDEIILNNLEQLYEIINSCNILYNLSHSRIMFNKCFEEKNFVLLCLFDDKLLTNDIICANIDAFYDVITKQKFLNSWLSNNISLFNKCLKEKNFCLSFKFNHNFWTSRLIREYHDDLYNYIVDFDVVPGVLINNVFLFNKCIENKKINLINKFQMDLDVYDQNCDVIYDEYEKGNFDLIFALNNNSKIVNKLVALGKNKLLLFFRFNSLILTSENAKKNYADLLCISIEELNNKLSFLTSKNDEILNTIFPFMLSKRMEVIPLKYIEKLGLYGDIQFILVSLNDIELKFVAKVLELFDKTDYDLNSIIYDILTNIKNYRTLIVNCDNLSDDNVKDLIYIIRRQDNIFNINSIDDVFNFKTKKNEYYKFIQNKIDNNTISIDEMKTALLERKYGLSLKMAEFIYVRYCSDMASLRESLTEEGFDKRLYDLLFDIANIYKNSSLDKMLYLWDCSDYIETDYITSIALESAIRKEYAKMYSDSLYKLDEKHNLINNQEFRKSNENIYDLLNYIQYDGEHPEIYILDGDFNLQIHVLGAYRHWERPKNFKNDWERPKIAYHGICTSYIGNDQIANARISHPVYGFDSYEESALLCAGNYDLFSDSSISQFASSVYKAYNFYPPQVMKNLTRGNHNEMVLERRNGIDNGCFKRKPNYVIYFVDDINNEDNFKESNSLFNETVQAAVDQQIPILVVDRLKYAQYEMAKCESLKQQFYATNDFKILRKLFLKFCNNMVGCRKFESQEDCAYHNIFNDNVLSTWFYEIFDYVKSINDEYMLESLLKVVSREYTMNKFINEIQDYIDQMSSEKVKSC